MAILSKLKDHEKVHDINKLFDSSMCPKVFKYKRGLLRHKKCAHYPGTQQFQCTDCNFKSVDETSLQNHILTHADIKQLHCSECLYKTASLKSLWQHITKHHQPSNSKANLFPNLNISKFKCDKCFFFLPAGSLIILSI